jgi:hypothetical protein
MIKSRQLDRVKFTKDEDENENQIPTNSTNNEPEEINQPETNSTNSEPEEIDQPETNITKSEQKEEPTKEQPMKKLSKTNNAWFNAGKIGSKAYSAFSKPKKA